MKAHVADYVEYRVSRSEEAFRVARRALEEGDLHEAVGRLYYACFHLVSALLLLDGHTSAKHKGIWTLLDLHWVKPRRLPREMGRFFHRLYRRRQDADYADRVHFNRDEVEEWFKEAQSFAGQLGLEIHNGLSRVRNEE